MAPGHGMVLLEWAYEEREEAAGNTDPVLGWIKCQWSIGKLFKLKCLIYYDTVRISYLSRIVCLIIIITTVNQHLFLIQISIM
jgi:hypothetical protein